MAALTDSFPYIHLKGEEENNQIHKEIDLVVKIRIEHRIYLWLYLAINDIRTTFENSLRPAAESIRLIPPSVNAAYKKILSRVPSRSLLRHDVR
ncbi:hypothetical protein N7507_008534 [Penicillium longicatenatum]|nr:hypothetical protein N7507_008534 [Penicillium longicatenatum]